MPLSSKAKIYKHFPAGLAEGVTQHIRKRSEAYRQLKAPPDAGENRTDEDDKSSNCHLKKKHEMATDMSTSQERPHVKRPRAPLNPGAGSKAEVENSTSSGTESSGPSPRNQNPPAGTPRLGAAIVRSRNSSPRMGSPAIRSRNGSPKNGSSSVRSRNSSPLLGSPSIRSRNSSPRIVSPSICSRNGSPMMASPSMRSRNSSPNMANPSMRYRTSSPRLESPSLLSRNSSPMCISPNNVFGSSGCPSSSSGVQNAITNGMGFIPILDPGGMEVDEGSNSPVQQNLRVQSRATTPRMTVSLDNVDLWGESDSENDQAEEFDRINGIVINPCKTFDFSELRKSRSPFTIVRQKLNKNQKMNSKNARAEHSRNRTSEKQRHLPELKKRDKNAPEKPKHSFSEHPRKSEVMVKPRVRIPAQMQTIMFSDRRLGQATQTDAQNELSSEISRSDRKDMLNVHELGSSRSGSTSTKNSPVTDRKVKFNNFVNVRDGKTTTTDILRSSNNSAQMFKQKYLGKSAQLELKDISCPDKDITFFI